MYNNTWLTGLWMECTLFYFKSDKFQGPISSVTGEKGKKYSDDSSTRSWWSSARENIIYVSPIPKYICEIVSWVWVEYHMWQIAAVGQNNKYLATSLEVIWASPAVHSTGCLKTKDITAPIGELEKVGIEYQVHTVPTNPNPMWHIFSWTDLEEWHWLPIA